MDRSLTLPLFVYGTLRDDDLRRQVLGRAVAVEAALARGVAAVFYPERVYPALIERRGWAAEGLVLLGLSHRDLALLDAYEGDEYVRRIVTVIAAGGPMTTQAYWSCKTVEGGAPVWLLADWRRNHKPAALAEAGRAASQARARS